MKAYKIYTLILGLSLSIVSCTQTYKIEGTWSDGAGEIIYLQQGDPKNKVNVDSIVVSPDGAFVFETKPEIAVYTVMPASGKNGKDVLVSEVPVHVTIQTVVRTRTDSTTYTSLDVDAGGIEQEMYEKAVGLINISGMMQFGKLFTLFAIQKGDITDKTPEDVVAEYDTLETNMRKSMIEFVDTATNYYGVTYFIKDYMVKKNTPEEVLKAYNNLSDRVKQSAPGVELKKVIDNLGKVIVGGEAPDIKLNTPEGEELSLYSLRGNYVLLDFWASWCGPCLREAPNVKAIYDKYHDKGFQVYGVSLDDDKEAWKAAIEKHNLDWLHVSSLQGWDCPVAKQYNVTGVPRMYIIDPQGKIIAMDLRGEKLAKFVEELYK